MGSAAVGQSERSQPPGEGEPLSRPKVAKTGGSEEASSARRAVDGYEGVYKRRFKNADVQGRRYDSEDILEIVRYGGDKVYFRTHLEFFNGHSCSLHGIAEYGDGDFLFTEPKLMVGESPCQLKIKRGKEAVVLRDESHSCKSFCGVRGSFNGASFSYKSRRTIRYLERLKNSRQYQEAVRDFGEKAKAK